MLNNNKKQETQFFGTRCGNANSIAAGYATETTNYGEIATGILNKSTKGDNPNSPEGVVGDPKATLFSVGCGTKENRKNALEVKGDGSVIISGKDGSNISIQDALDGKDVSPELQHVIQHLSKTATFAGVATPTTNPGKPNLPVFYLTTQAGTYADFDGLHVNVGELAILKWNGTWNKQVIKIIGSSGYIVDDTLSDLSENPVQNKVITAGISTEFSEISLGTFTNDKYLSSDGLTKSYTGISVSDFIDISIYQNKILKLSNGVRFSQNACQYCLYDINKNKISQAHYIGLTSVVDISVENACFIRVSCKTADINKVKLILPAISTPGLKSIQSLKKDIESIPTTTLNIYGVALDNNYMLTEGGSKIAPTGFFVKLKPKIYTKIKAYINPPNTSHTIAIYALDPDCGVMYNVASFTLSGDAGTIVETPIHLDLRGYKAACFIADGLYFKTDTNNQYENLELFMGRPNDGMTLDEFDSAKAFKSKVSLNISLEYTEFSFGKSSGTSVELPHLSDYFYGKGYVSFGDSITVTPDLEKCYPMNIAKYFKMALTNAGASGSRPLKDSNLSDANLSRVTSDTRLVTISGGQNEWVTSEDINSLDRSTSVGAVNYFIDNIRKISPMCVIVLCPTYIGNGDNQCAKDYKRISENKHVGLAPTLDLTLLDWEFDKKVKVMRPDNVHFSAFGAAKFAAVCREYIKQLVF